MSIEWMKEPICHEPIATCCHAIGVCRVYESPRKSTWQYWKSNLSDKATQIKHPYLVCASGLEIEDIQSFGRIWGTLLRHQCAWPTWAQMDVTKTLIHCKLNNHIQKHHLLALADWWSLNSRLEPLEKHRPNLCGCRLAYRSSSSGLRSPTPRSPGTCWPSSSAAALSAAALLTGALSAGALSAGAFCCLQVTFIELIDLESALHIAEDTSSDGSRKVGPDERERTIRSAAQQLHAHSSQEADWCD